MSMPCNEHWLIPEEEQVVGELVRQSTDCPDTDDLIRYVNLQPTKIGDARLVGHLALCNACMRTALVLAEEFQPIMALHGPFRGWKGAWLDVRAQWANDKLASLWDIHTDHCRSCQCKTMLLSRWITRLFPWLKPTPQVHV